MGRKNIAQGEVIYDDYVIFDPLPEDTFGANIHLTLTNDFKIDKDTQRCIVVPLYIRNNGNVEIASAAEKFKIDFFFENSLYSLYYEVCEGDEIFYKLTFIPSETPITPMYLMDDPWGGEKINLLRQG